MSAWIGCKKCGGSVHIRPEYEDYRKHVCRPSVEYLNPLDYAKQAEVSRLKSEHASKDALRDAVESLAESCRINWFPDEPVKCLGLIVKTLENRGVCRAYDALFPAPEPGMKAILEACTLAGVDQDDTNDAQVLLSRFAAKHREAGREEVREELRRVLGDSNPEEGQGKRIPGTPGKS